MIFILFKELRVFISELKKIRIIALDKLKLRLHLQLHDLSY